MINHLLIGCEKKEEEVASRLIVFPKTKMKKNQLFYFITIRGPSNYGGQPSFLNFMGFEHLNFIVFI